MPPGKKGILQYMQKWKKRSKFGKRGLAPVIVWRGRNCGACSKLFFLSYVLGSKGAAPPILQLFSLLCPLLKPLPPPLSLSYFTPLITNPAAAGPPPEKKSNGSWEETRKKEKDTPRFPSSVADAIFFSSILFVRNARKRRWLCQRSNGFAGRQTKRVSPPLNAGKEG